MRPWPVAQGGTKAAETKPTPGLRPGTLMARVLVVRRSDGPAPAMTGPPQLREPT